MISLVLYLIFTSVFLIDMLGDHQDNVPVQHIYHEVILFSLAIVAAAWQAYQLFKKQKQLYKTIELYDQALVDYENWKKVSKNSAKEIRILIEQQFDQWGLSLSEKDVALLLIKGLSMKEIATLRGTHEKTVRQQSAALYKKSGLAGRNELSAFFLEDILSAPIHES